VDASRQIRDAVQRIKGRTGRASWVAADAYHLTYAFLGEQPEEVVGPLARRLSTELASCGPVSVTFSGGGFFPKETRARVAWIGIDDPNQLGEIAAHVRQALDDLGVTYDRKPFRPHLTISRIRGRWSRSDTELYLRTIDGLGSLPVDLERIVLYRSELSSGGARHHEMAVVALSR